MPAPHNQLKAALAQGRLQRGVWLNLPGGVTAEMAGRAGFDWCLIDGEHGPWDPAGIREQLMALDAAGTPAVVRTPMAEDWIMKQVLDLGAQTILVPMVQSAAEARQIVRACRYPPNGVRGMGAGVARAGRFGAIDDYPGTSDAEICIILQAESAQAMEDLESIARIDGVDGVFIGPADLGADLGFRDDLANPDLWDVIEAGVETIRSKGKAAGVLAMDPHIEARMVEVGVTFLGCGSDAVLLKSALARLARGQN